MAATNYAKSARHRRWLVWIQWDATHDSPKALFEGRVKDVEALTRDLRKLLGTSGTNAYPQVRRHPQYASVDDLKMWAKNNRRENG